MSKRVRNREKDGLSEKGQHYFWELARDRESEMVRKSREEISNIEKVGRGEKERKRERMGERKNGRTAEWESSREERMRKTQRKKKYENKETKNEIARLNKTFWWLERFRNDEDENNDFEKIF